MRGIGVVLAGLVAAVRWDAARPIKVADLLEERDRMLQATKASDSLLVEGAWISVGVGTKAFSSDHARAIEARDGRSWQFIPWSPTSLLAVSASRRTVDPPESMKGYTTVDSVRQDFQALSDPGYEEVLPPPTMEGDLAHVTMSEVSEKKWIEKELDRLFSLQSINDSGTFDEKKTRPSFTESGAETMSLFRQQLETASRSYLLASVVDTSVFTLLPAEDKTPDVRNTIVERFFNGQEWVHVRHSLPPQVNVESICMSFGRLLAIDAQGQVWERRRNNQDDLEWTTTPGRNLKGGGCRPSGRLHSESLYFLTSDGALVERLGFPLKSTDVSPGASESSLSWIDYEMVYEERELDREKPVHIADAESLEPGVVYFIGERASLLQGRLDQRRRVVELVNLGHPFGVYFSPVQAALVPGQTTMSLFFVTVGGQVVEFQQAKVRDKFSKRSFKWIHHRRPQGSVIAPVTGLVLNPQMLVFITEQGGLVERHFMDKTWRWIDHHVPRVNYVNDLNHPPQEEEVKNMKRIKVPLLPVAGVVLTEYVMIFVCVGRFLIARHWSPSGWVWNLHPLPGVGSGKYCVSDINSRYSCMALPSEFQDRRIKL